MSYIPKSEEQLAKEGLLPEGTYDFEIVDTSDKPSKKGNDMYTLKLNCFAEDEGTYVIYDYIALGNNFGERKLRHAADACNIIPIYETGNLKPADFLGKTGKIVIGQQEGNTEYPLPKNIVKDYVKRAQAGAVRQESVATGALPLDDEIPF